MHSQDFHAHLYADGFCMVISTPDLPFRLPKGTSPATLQIRGPVPHRLVKISWEMNPIDSEPAFIG